MAIPVCTQYLAAIYLPIFYVYMCVLVTLSMVPVKSADSFMVGFVRTSFLQHNTPYHHKASATR
jgi:hypothetical protein